MSLWETNMGASFADISGITKKASCLPQGSHPKPFSRKWAFKNIFKTKNPIASHWTLAAASPTVTSSPVLSGSWSRHRMPRFKPRRGCCQRELPWASYPVPQDPDQTYPIWNPSSAFLSFENLLPSCPERTWHDLGSLVASEIAEDICKISEHPHLEVMKLWSNSASTWFWKESLRGNTATPLHLHILWGCFADKTA